MGKTGLRGAVALWLAALAAPACQAPPTATAAVDAGPGADAGAECIGRLGQLHSTLSLPGIMAIAVPDLNGDGIPDVAALRGTAYEPDTLAIAFGTASGSFGEPVYLTAYEGTADGWGIVTADIDRDGDDDLATLAGDTLKIWLNDGIGSFPTTFSYEASCGGALYAELVDGDEHLDLIAGCSGVPVFYGEGDGRFSPERPALPGTQRPPIALGYIDDDSRIDLVEGGATTTLHPGGASGFRAAGVLLSTRGSDAVALLDHDKDGRLDVIAGGWQWTTAEYIHNLGDGAFATPELVELGIQPGALIAADIQADPRPEIIAIESSGYPWTGSLTSIVQMGIGNPWDPPRLIPTIDGLTSVAVARQGGTHRTYVTNGYLTTTLPEVNARPMEWPAETLITADVDGDGSKDVIAIHTAAGHISISRADASIAWEPLLDVPDGWHPAGAAAGDYTGDGAPDLIVTTNDGSALLFENRGDAWFRSARPWTAQPVEPMAQSGDIDGDGNVDVVFAAGYHGPLIVSFGDGAGAEAQRVELDSNATAYPHMILEDLDRDGLDDLVFATGWQDERVWIAFARPDRTFDRVEITGGIPYTISTGDLVGQDGRRELLLQRREEDQTSLEVIQVHDDRSTEHSFVQLPTAYNDLEAEDLDGDGETELVGQRGSIVELLTGAGALLGGHAFAIVEPRVVDMNGDGHLDIAGISWPGGTRSSDAEAIYWVSSTCP